MSHRQSRWFARGLSVTNRLLHDTHAILSIGLWDGDLCILDQAYGDLLAKILIDAVFVIGIYQMYEYA